MARLSWPSRYRILVIDSVRRACGCRAAVVHRQMARGIAALSVIAQTGIFVGLIGTVVGIMNSFHSIGTSKSTGLDDVSKHLGEALVPVSLGLVTSILGAWARKYLGDQMAVFDIEMENASVGLVNSLLPQIARLRVPVLVALPAGDPDVATDPSLLSLEGERSRLIGLVWPRLDTIGDAIPVLRDGGTVSVVYGVISWLLFWTAHQPVRGAVSLLFFAVAGMGVNAGSRFALGSLFAFLTCELIDCSIAYHWLFGSLCLAVSPLFFIGSWKAAAYLARAGGFRDKNWWHTRARSMATITVLLGSFPAWVEVREAPLIAIYSTESGEQLLCLSGPLMGPIRLEDEILLWDGASARLERIAGLPGDSMRLQSGRLFRNGQRVEEPFVRDFGTLADYPSAWAADVYIVRPDSYFVLNDNRNDLFDSRTFGEVHRDEILGRPVYATRFERDPGKRFHKVW